ncbi:MAG: BamA/TamA family outer membrane protein, partial [Chlorobi bacterium]|nr:BamA/TamA family outer membrane protein [Chlorobiota bacterium]
FQYKNRTDNYWGVGYDNGDRMDKSDTTTAYDRTYFKFKQRVMFNLGSNLFLGPVVDLNISKASNLNQVMMTDEYVLSQGTEFSTMGFGIAFEHDSRDFPSNAYKGWYLGGTIAYYNDWIKSDASYFRTEVTYKQYITIRRKRRVLSWQVRAIMSAGNFIPWADMAKIGGKNDLRGYTLGRYRDKELLTAVVEYRHMFKRKRMGKDGTYNSRWGYVVWVGAGSVAPEIVELKDWLPNGGAGLRFEIRDRMNVRVDAGLGKGEHGFYVTFKEAF